ncbi:HPr family phosphocarrier protein [Paenibacillus hamazuiensis]|uniref:HPr family phosphocarrier protein n=1 Tax=Paenibacillus hamazuiensis TaxID=2936508 RepID=UPI00200DD248|nr:HPr family phosphocarrier protein [Paenibacillus hamazuiensis]
MRVHDLEIPKNFEKEDLQRLTREANQFSSDIKIRYITDHQVEVDMKSLLGMMLVPIEKGTKITLVTKGPDEKEAIDFISELLEKPSLS